MVVKTNINLSRPLHFVAALALAVAAILPALQAQKAGAYSLIDSRSIMMSDSAVSGGGRGTDVNYLVTGTTPSTQTIGGLVIDFCSNASTPIIGDTCTAPTGFDVNEGTLVISNQSGITDWQIDAATTASKLVLTRTGGAASFTAGTFSLTLGSTGGSDGVTNPSTLGTFYARILTFAASTGATGYTSTNIDNTGANVVHHAGGVALSTANTVTIQSKVQERLTFCIYTTGSNCPGSISNPVLLGDANGVLDPATQYTTATSANGNPKFGLASNAASGVVVNMKGGTLKRTPGCADGTGQNCSIDRIGTSATLGAFGGEQFGVRLTNLGANITATAPYNGSAGNFAFDDNNTTGTQSTYGDQIASMPASAEQQGEMEFVGNIANTTESGIYTTTLTFIATGTY